MYFANYVLHELVRRCLLCIEKPSWTHRSRHPIFLDASERTHFIKVDITEFRLLDHLGIESTLELHHMQKHLVVGPAWEKDLASVELEQRTSDGPNVKGGVVRYAENCRSEKWVLIQEGMTRA